MKGKKGEKNDSDAENKRFEQVVWELCRQYNFKCRFTNSDLIMITTRIGYWRLECKSNYPIKIYHNNHNPDMGIVYKNSKKFNEGFHVQPQICTWSIKEALEYIYNHEKSYLDLGYTKVRIKI